MEALGEWEVLAEDVGQNRGEKVVKRLEAAAEDGCRGERGVGLDFEVLGEDIPASVPVGSELVDLGGREPPDLAP